MSESLIERCGNCGRVIGKLETPMVWRESVVCAECHARLGDGVLPLPVPPQKSNNGRAYAIIGLLLAGIAIFALAYLFPEYQRAEKIRAGEVNAYSALKNINPYSHRFNRYYHRANVDLDSLNAMGDKSRTYQFLSSANIDIFLCEETAKNAIEGTAVGMPGNIKKQMASAKRDDNRAEADLDKAEKLLKR